MRFFDTRLGRCATLLALGGGVALYAQGTQTASATVTVVDKSGNAVANARVRLTSPSMMAERTGVTNSSGVFVARLLPPGTYTIEVIRDGFQTTRDVRAIGIDQHYQPRIVLQPVGNTTVEVVATASSAIDPTSVQMSHNYPADKIDELPMGRTPDAMALLSPGVTTGMGGRTQVRGAMTSSNLYLLDGQPVADNTYMTNTTHLITDSFEETQVMTGAISAEYGNVDGGVINTITKSGGNTFSGQFRADLSNNQWNAVRALTTDAQRTTIANTLNESRQYSLGGFFIKDRLWFHVAAYTQDTASAGNISTASTHPTEMGMGFTQDTERLYLQGKLTWRVNDDHALVVSYSNNEVTTNNRAQFTMGEIKALGEQGEASGILNVAWRATWSSDLNTEVRFGYKDQSLGSGPKAGTRNPNNLEDSVVRTYGASPQNVYYNTYPFAQRDNPEHRDNQTANIKASYFLNDMMGTHQIDAGFDYYKGIRSGINQQSITGYTFFVFRMLDPTATGDEPYAAPNFVIKWPGDPAESTSTSMGLYINDKWKLNNHWAFQIGFRFDNYSAEATDTKQTSGASGFSPRLGVTYDVLGDQQIILKASYCIYNAAVLEVITGAVSGAANIGQVEWDWTGPGGYGPTNYQPRREVFNLDNYQDFQGSYNPLVNIFINPDMKAPTCDEIQLSAAYSLKTADYGNGYLSLTYVNRSWKNMIDVSSGNNPINTVPDPDGPEYPPFYTSYWDNEPLAKRDYNALELMADWTFGRLHIGGNITWSKLEGNYEGEGSSSPGSGQGLSNWREFYNDYKMEDGKPVLDEDGDPIHTGVFRVDKLYDSEVMDPVGFLAYHKPVTMTWTADYTSDNKFGRTTFGFIYTRSSGLPYGRGRTVPASIIHPLMPYTEYGRNSSQNWNNQRTFGSYNSSAYHDLAITHDFDLFKVAGTQVRGFAKIVIYNVFNHQQLLTWAEPGFKAVTAAELEEYGVTSYDQLDKVPWVEDPGLGVNQRRGYVANTNMGAPRTFSLSFGLRF
jgi:outer membrane receptor for ferrienterochelin and colicin